VISALYDTNVLISGLFWAGLPKQAWQLARERRVYLVTSEQLLAELQDVLTRPDKPFCLSPSEADEVVTEIRRYARVVTPTRKVAACRDPKDNAVLEAALAGQVSYLVTDDPDLKSLGQFEGIKIVDVRTFVTLVERRGR
jgi:putative PIN family toxin of toxin-antitoxin system